MSPQESQFARISVQIEPDLRRMVKRAAVARGVSMRQYVESALRQAVEIDSFGDMHQSPQSQSTTLPCDHLSASERRRGFDALEALEELRGRLQSREGTFKRESWELLQTSRDNRVRSLDRTKRK